MKDLRARSAAEGFDIAGTDSSGSSGRWYFDATHLRLDNVHSRIAFDSVPVAIALCDLGGRLVHANRAFQEMLSLDTLEGIENHGIVELLKGALPAGLVETLADRGLPLVQLLEPVAAGAAAKLRCDGRRIAGDAHAPRWLVFCFSRVDDAESPARAGGPAVDWGTMDAQLGVARWQLHVAGATVAMDSEMAWSDGATEVLGLHANMRMRTPREWLQRIVPADRLRVAENLRRLARSGAGCEDEYRLAGHGERRERVIHTRACRIPHPAVPGEFVLLGIERDVTGQHSADQQRRYALEAFKAIVENSESPMCAVNRRLQLVVANGAFRSVMQSSFGTSADAGFELRTVLADATVRRRIIFNLRRALRGERRVEATGFAGADGLCTTYDLAYSPVTLEDGTVIGVAVCSSPIGTGSPVAGSRRTSPHSRRRRAP